MASTDKAAAAAEQPQIRVWLGNRAAIELVEDTDARAGMSAEEIREQGVPKTRRPIPVSKTATFLALEPGLALFDRIRDITRLWPHMSDAAAPAWVASTDRRTAELLAEHYGGIEVREPENPDEMHGPYVVDGGVAGKGA